MTTRADRANGRGIPGRGTGSGVRLVNLNRALALVAYRLANLGKDLAAEWRQESTQPREAYRDLAEYCFLAALPATVVATSVLISVADYTIGYAHLLARVAVYGLAPLPLICSLAAFVECLMRSGREPAAFNYDWTKKGYQTPTRIDFITNPRVLLASSLVGTGAALATGVLLGLWDPFNLA